MATVGRLNYKIGADTDQLNAAMVMSKAQMRDAQRVMRETASPAQVLANQLDNLQVLYEKGGITLEAYGQKMVQLKSSTPEAIRQQKDYASAQAEAKSITDRNTTAHEKYASAVKRLVELKPHLSAEAYSRELERLKQLLPELASREEKRATDKLKRDRELAAAQAEARQIMQRNMTAEERYAAALSRLNELKPHLSLQAYNAELRKLNATLPDAVAKEERHNATVREAKALTASVITEEEKRIARLSRINELLLTGHITQETYNRLIAQEVQIEKQRSSKTPGSTPDQPKQDGSTAILGLSKRFLGAAAVTMAAKEVWNLTTSVETSSAAFEVLIGDVRRAKQMVGEMKQLDAESVLGFNDIALAGKTLLGYGTAVGTVMPSLTALSQISMGNVENFKHLALAFGQVQAVDG